MTIFKKIKNLFNHKHKPLYVSGQSLIQIPDSDYSSTSGITFNGIPLVVTDDNIKNICKNSAMKIYRIIKIEKKPVEIFKELISENPIINLRNIDNQIKTIKRRIDVLRNELGMNLTDELEALDYLYARKKLFKYPNCLKWAITNKPLIDKLCQNYAVAFVDCNMYYKTLPQEAINELENFLKEYKKYKKDKPILRLIIDDKKEDNKPSPERKKDPILLASSPFGRWWYILGAWDKEVEIVDDLIYNYK
jgi:hypothetical protein